MIPQHLSLSNEWYTPAIYVDSARRVMGGIDLDPASCSTANEVVEAGNYFSLSENGDDGLELPWHGKVWLNPPYGRGEKNVSNQELWLRKAVREFNSGHIDQAVILLNAVPDRSWFKMCWPFAICFTNHRVKFWSPSGNCSQPPNGNAFVYIADFPDFHNNGRFRDEFIKYGAIIPPGTAIWR